MSIPIENITFSYRFKFLDAPDKKFIIRLDQKTLTLQSTQTGNPPDWTKLKCRQCPNCPLDKATHPYCPIAVNLVEVIDFFSNSDMESNVTVIIETKERSYDKRVLLK
jgi:hypothetical protein